LTHPRRTQDDWSWAALFLDLGLEHHRRGAGDAAIFSDAPEMNAHEDRGDQRDGDAMPYVRTEESVRIHDRPAEKRKPDVVVGRHAHERAERALAAEQRCGAAHIRADGDGPEAELIIRQQVAG